jgi:hypothetical protein
MSEDGARTQLGGTPLAVDYTRDRLARRDIALFVAGPVIWSVHFMAVYLVAEAGCTGDGPGLDVFDPPVPVTFTLAATAVAALASLAAAWWSYRAWKAPDDQPAAADDRPSADEAAEAGRGAGPEDRDPGRPLAFVGLLHALLSFVGVLLVGLPALVLTC